MNEQINDVIMAKNMLENTRHRLKQLRKIPLFERGHIDNEDLLKLQFREKQLKSIIKVLKKRKPAQDNTEKQVSNSKNYHGEYF